MPSQEKYLNFWLRWQPAKFVSALITLLMLGVTLGYWNNERMEASDMRQHVFAGEADHVTQRIQRRLSDFDLVLRGVKGLYESSDYVSREDFRQYYKALALDQMRPALQGIAIALRVPWNRNRATWPTCSAWACEITGSCPRVIARCMPRLS